MTINPFNLLGRDGIEAHLRAGGAALLPTDTLPALASMPEQAAQIWRLKRRPQDKPLILMGADVDALLCHVAPAARADAKALAQLHWPGALTLVLPAFGPCAESLNPGVATLGLRIPACKPMLDLLRCSGPLATTSANLSGEPASRTESEAAGAFPDLPLLAPTPWPAPSCQASSVIAWRGPHGWHCLRRGAVMPAGVVSFPECSG
jgi:L-threonylcarbamoyladenylate synthase